MYTFVKIRMFELGEFIRKTAFVNWNFVERGMDKYNIYFQR